MENFISNLGLAVVCIVGMVIWAFMAYKKFKKYVEKDPFGDYPQPQTASILGVLGTFLGISVGLINFNPAQDAIHQSVVNLLGGMTTAFFTSIAGMGISLVFKDYQANAHRNFQGVKSESTVADLINYLQESDAQKAALIQSLIKSVTGDDDSTVTGQIKMLKADLRDEFKTLSGTLQANNEKVIRELKNFGETLAESNSKAFVEALTDTMKDFNQKMTEQFGENFKQFNVAVGRLLEWQENYKTIIEIVTQNLQATVDGISAVKNSFEQIAKSAASMTESSEQIQNLIVTANFYEQKLAGVLKEVQALGAISQSAVNDIAAFVQNSCNEIQSYTKQATQDVNAHVNSVVDNLENQMSDAAKNSVEMTRQIFIVGNTSFEKILEVTEKNLNLLQSVSHSYATEIQNYTKQATQDVNAHVNSVTDNLKIKMQNTINQNDEMMKTNDENLKKSLETLGRAMLKISGKFVEDYTPLVNELRKIVEISKQVRGGTLF